MQVTVLGIGTMGHGVAASLARAGHDVTVWNRSPGKTDDLTGVRIATDPASAVADADVVLMTLFDEQAVTDVLEQAGGAAREDTVWVQCATIGVEGTARVTDLAAQRNLRFVEAMMLGTKAPAENGQLTMLAAGPSELLDRIAPVLDAIGAKTVVAGERIGDGTALKLAANAWIASITAATAQSLAIARSLGLDASLFLDAIDGTASDSPYAHTKGGAMIAGTFDPQFALDGLRKDIGLIAAAAGDGGVDTTLLAAIADRYRAASDAGHGGDDIAAVVTAFGPVA
jgi:3-hydroxyisobutyrate dehydrogenase